MLPHPVLNVRNENGLVLGLQLVWTPRITVRHYRGEDLGEWKEARTKRSLKRALPLVVVW